MTYGNYPDLKSVKRILVIKMRHLGDVLLTTPLFSRLKEALPDAEIDAYIYKESHPMLEGHSAISSFLLYDRKWKELSFWRRLKKEVEMVRRLRKRNYDLVINLTEGDRGALAALLSKSPIRVGMDPGKKRKRALYTHLVKVCHSPRHMVERQLDALRALGIFPGPLERELSFTIPDEALRQAEARLERLGLQAKEYLLIHPVSRWLFKCPPPAFYRSLIEKLLQEGERVVLTAGPSEKESSFVRAVAEGFPDEVVNLAGTTSLKELGALISMSRALITVDSVPLHMGSALKTPVVALFGPSSEEEWGPWMHPQSAVVSKALPCRPCGLDGCGGGKLSDCLFTLSEEAVLDAFHQLRAKRETASLKV
ncbi:MAG TPA: putative lipopolysaccharide heptosyltransferase III [Parachlamydiales bacterium]|nr:putative lipopolysaccharide heptosyltransferase III [Parachlamydiales bacterium]